MKHQPYKAFFLFPYISSSEIHKRSNILMTIKLSTTNSVNKTLQHKKKSTVGSRNTVWRQSWLQ